MFKKVSSIFLVVTIIVVAMGSVMVNTASAQEGTIDPNTPVSNLDGAMTGAQESGILTDSEPFQGTGMLAPESAQLAGPGTFAGPVREGSPESVIGRDGRKRVNATTNYPNRAIAYLLVTFADSSVGSCTGWYIGPRTVVTAGHCVFNTARGAGHGWATSILVYPGRNGATAPYGVTSAYRLFSVTGWTNSGAAGKPAYDYGAIQTNDALGDIVGWFGWRWQASNVFAGTYNVRGYPGDKPDATLWTMAGGITSVASTRLWYSIDTYGGQSGSPLYKNYDGQCCYGFGVHTYGTSVPPYFGNSATRISKAVAKNFGVWKAVVYP